MMRVCLMDRFLPCWALELVRHNARGEPRPAAAARDERRLLGVGSSAMLGRLCKLVLHGNTYALSNIDECRVPVRPLSNWPAILRQGLELRERCFVPYDRTKNYRYH